ncbi:MAG: hypothetical protein GC147_00510 [Porphyrobacter sp.]|nr:hypothetical protein [Porphyrobacter sp.]
MSASRPAASRLIRAAAVGVALLATSPALAGKRPCAELEGVDLKRIGTAAPVESVAFAAGIHASLMEDLDFDAFLAGASAVIRVAGWPSGPGPGSLVSVAAVRRDGQWYLARAYRETAAPLPSPPFITCALDESRRTCFARTPPYPPPTPTELSQGRAPAALAARLEAALIDQCLLAEPPRAPALVPMKRRKEERPCFDGGVDVLEIRTDTLQRAYAQVCQRRWRAGDLITALMQTGPEAAGQ